MVGIPLAEYFRTDEGEGVLTETNHLQNHRTTEYLRLAGTNGDHLVQPTCSRKATYTWLLRTVSRQLLNIPRMETPQSLGNLCHCWVMLTEKNNVPGTIYNNIHRELAVFQLVTLFYVLSQDTTENRLALSSLHHPFRYLYIFIRSVLTFSYPG